MRPRDAFAAWAVPKRRLRFSKGPKILVSESTKADTTPTVTMPAAFSPAPAPMMAAVTKTQVYSSHGK